MTPRNVVIDQLPPDDTYVEIPKGNDRMFAITLCNLRRGRRITKGTATIWRLRALIEAIRKRHPRAHKSPPKPGTAMFVYARRFGPSVMTVESLPGPVASIATKH